MESGELVLGRLQIALTDAIERRHDERAAFQQLEAEIKALPIEALELLHAALLSARP